MAGAPPTASTLLGVAVLGYPDQLFEIDGIAALPADGARLVKVRLFLCGAARTSRRGHCGRYRPASAGTPATPLARGGRIG